MAQLPAKQGPWDKQLIREVAMDIGKAVVHHVETMYPAAIKATPSTFKLSLRNTVYNEIIAAIAHTDEAAIRSRLAERKRRRRKSSKFFRDIREE